MKVRLLLVLTTLCLLYPFQSYAYKDNANAPLQIKGEVKNDVLYEEMDGLKQIRKMSLLVEKIEKNQIEELALSKGDTITVFYHYRPSWKKYDGPLNMDIMVGDGIEIWLTKGDYGWEPYNSGSSVIHHVKVKHRKEPIPEPWINYLLFTEHPVSSLLFFSGVAAFIIFIIIKIIFLKKN